MDLGNAEEKRPDGAGRHDEEVQEIDPVPTINLFMEGGR